MTLGMDIGLGPGDFVFDGDPPPPETKPQPQPIFGPCLLWRNGSIGEETTWYGSRLRPRPRCGTGGLSFPRERATAPPPLFPALVYCGHGAHLTSAELFFLPILNGRRLDVYRTSTDDVALVMVALCNRAEHYIFILFLLSSFFFFFLA